MKILLTSFIALFMIISCTITTGNGGETIVGKGEQVKKERQLEGPIDQINIEGVFITKVTQGKENKAIIDAQENVHPFISTSVDKGVLTLGYVNNTKVKKMKKFNIELQVKDLDKINFDGVGTLKVVDLKTDSLIVNANSVGSIELTGSSNYIAIANNGVGSVNATDFITKNCKAVNAGVGSVSVHATEQVDLTNDGVGSIRYSGNPATKTIHKNGLGSIKSN